ncbi:MAG TPA: glucose-6-phosphate dehydrogenase assembly protein OpcA [Candidatus Baltobacteraceae bacterium]|nr:glucose-6-phosphate dehydrogenase assembly protein OpcA [Candidatus Baltobacteraceae bacterium]
MSAESKVDASLESIRTELARNPASTTTLNLIVWIDDPKRRDWIVERATMLAEKHPSFTLILDNTGECGEAATVTTRARAGGGTLSASQGERVELDVSCYDAPKVAEYVETLSRSGVPTLLWWSGMKVGSRPVFDALLPHADTLLVDSAGSVTDERGLRSLVGFRRDHPEIVLRDLAWLRLRPWLDMIANFFDDRQSTREAFTIRRLTIASGSAAEALYLAAWLASSLNWKAAGPDTFSDMDGNRVTFSREERGEIRRVQRVCVETETTSYCAEVTDNPQVVRVASEGANALEPRLYPLRALDNASLLERAVLEPGRDTLYETTLATVGTLLG